MPVETGRRSRLEGAALGHDDGERATPCRKTGLGYTPHDLGALPRPAFADGISEDVAWFGLRVTQKARVHGFRAGAAFFLVFLDRNHDAFPA